MTGVRILLRRLAPESGYSLVELVTTMAILGTVVATLTGLFVSGTRSQLDLNERVQAQNNASTGLGRLRRDVHCSNGVQGTPTSSLIVLKTPCATGGLVSWCTTATSTGRFALRRAAAASCTASSSIVGDYLTTAAVFTYAGATSATKEVVRTNVVVKTPKMKTAYALCDVLVMRNSAFGTAAAGTVPAC